MVTTTENFLQRLSAREQWNLKDVEKKDAWMLHTHSALVKAGVYKALEHGRPTLDALKKEYPKLGARAAQATVDTLMVHYEEQIGIAWDVLIPRLDLADHWLCNEINRHVGTRNGQAVWDLIKKECDVSTGAKQDSIVSEWENFKVPANLWPSPRTLTFSLASAAWRSPRRSAQSRR